MALVILVAGLSLIQYACYAVNSRDITGQALVTTLNKSLLVIGLSTFGLGTLLHYLSVRRMTEPIRRLSAAASAFKEGHPLPELPLPEGRDVRILTENFIAMARSITEAQTTRDDLLRDVAHEMRTPLTNINGYLEALEQGVIKGDTVLFTSLLEESRRITRIVELLTELDRWTDGNMPLHLDDVISIDQLVKDTIQSYRRPLDHSFDKVEFSFENSYVRGDADGLRQVIVNLLQNMLAYDTGRILRIQGTTGTVYYRLTFEHTGQWIDPSNKERIFERFYRSDASRSIRTEGAGLGLAITRSIVEAHGGRIGIETSGTDHLFFIDLPLHANN